MYKLVYSGNVNRYDTPYFLDELIQYEWFDARKVYTVDDIFPPHYTNIIRFEYDDIKDLNYDYLMLQFTNKWYYYFVDKITYINAGIVDLSITMDVIQTYMFNFDIANCDIIRESIPRWTSDGYINRNYVRENLSSGTFELKYMSERYKCVKPEYEDRLNLLTQVPYYVALLFTEPLSSQHSELIINSISTGLYLVLLPITAGKVTIYTSDNHIISTSSSLNQLYDNPALYKIMLLTNAGIIESLSIKYTLSGNKYITRTNYVKYNESYYLAPYYDNFNTNEFYCLSNDYTPIKNEGNYEEFNYKFVPAILDSNYIRIYCGERMQNTSIRLELVPMQNILCKMNYDLLNNTRTYYIGTEEDDLIDKYNNQIQNSSIEDLTIVNDYWKQYQAQNQGTLTTGVALAKTNARVQYYNAVGQTIGAAGNIALSGNLGGVGSTIANAFLAPANLYAAYYNIDQNLKITRENLEYQPNSITSGNKMFSDYAQNSFVPIAINEVVSDIEMVAKKYELYGYKTNRHLDDDPRYDFKRRYWNILQLDNIKIDTYAFISEDEKQLIYNRFKNGIRFIMVEDLDMIQPHTVITKILKYDNLEVDL